MAHERIVDRIEEKDGLGAAEAMLFVIDAGYERVEAERHWALSLAVRMTGPGRKAATRRPGRL